MPYCINKNYERDLLYVKSTQVLWSIELMACDLDFYVEVRGTHIHVLESISVIVN